MTGARERMSPPSGGTYFEQRLRVEQPAGQLDRSARGGRIAGRGVEAHQQDGPLGVWLWYEFAQLLERKRAGQASQREGRADSAETPAPDGVNREGSEASADPRLASGRVADLINKTQAAAASTEQIAAVIADKQRAAYGSRDAISLSRLRRLSTSISDLCLDLAAAVGSLADLEQDLVHAQRPGADLGVRWPGGGTKGPVLIPSGWLSRLQAFDKVFASIQCVLGSASWFRSERPDGGTASAPKTAAAGMISLDGLVEMADAVGLALDAAIGPMVAECDRILSNLNEITPDENKAALALGSCDQVSWDREAGGRALFNFMRVMMAAKSPDDVPSPVPLRVAAYFVKQRVRIEAGVTGGKEGDKVPTTGFWLWRRADQRMLASWIFSHRQQLWAIFYGNTRRPDKA
jgi:hypothetical protein